VVTFAYTGFLPRFPGTWGTLGAAALFGLALAMGVSDAVLFWATGAVALAVTTVSIPLGNRARAVFGKPDPGQFVLDEVAGFFVSLSFLCGYSVWTGGAAFVVFRLLDIGKPWPIKKVESLPGGWGITLDDVLAGLLANLVVRLARIWVPFV